MTAASAPAFCAISAFAIASRVVSPPAPATSSRLPFSAAAMVTSRVRSSGVST